MSVAAVAPGAGRSAITRRNIIIAVILALAAAGALFIATRPDLVKSVANRFGNSVSQGVKDGVQGIKTVAAMMAERSPGERAKGALASLKHKRVSEVHERALPKVRRPAARPVSPLAAILMPPPGSPEIPPVAPVVGMAAAPPVPIPPIGELPIAGGGPPIVAIPPPGGGGGGGIIPPVTTTPGTPTPPPTQTSAVPEPDTWALMLLGFGLVGLAVRRDRRRTALAGSD